MFSLTSQPGENRGLGKVSENSWAGEKPPLRGSNFQWFALEFLFASVFIRINDVVFVVSQNEIQVSN